MQERQRFDRELDDLNVREFDVAAPATPPTVGFEFDVHYGFLQEVLDDAGKAMPTNGDRVTNHDYSPEGFKVKRDGPRLEIATKPFTVDAAGKKEIKETQARIQNFVKQLGDGCTKAKPKAIKIEGVADRPRPFDLPNAIDVGIPIVKLPVGGKFTSCTVWASPQATVTLPLSSVGKLISRIKASEGNGPGVAMTGTSPLRMGLRSDAVYNAKRAVDRMWLEMVNHKPPLTLPSDKSVVINRTTFTENIKGLLMLLASYMWTSELKYDFKDPRPRDYEPFGKAYLPLNVKAPFCDVRSELLSAAERKVFDEMFAVGDARVRMFQLVKRSATKADGDNKLLPPGRKELGEDSVHRRQKAAFGVVPTWDDLIDHTLNSSHRSWGPRLIVPLSKMIDLDKTKPRVAIEMRRFGFTAVTAGRWNGMMNRVTKMVEDLN